MTPKHTALAFVEAINRHDVPAILALMSEDHVFIDTYGHTQPRQEMESGWPGYFAWFPDYHIQVIEVLESADAVVLIGFAGGTYRQPQGRRIPEDKRRWRLPAVFRVMTEDGLVRVWQVFCDSKTPYDIMDAANNQA